MLEFALAAMRFGDEIRIPAETHELESGRAAAIETFRSITWRSLEMGKWSLRSRSIRAA